ALGRYQLQIGERGAARTSFQRAASLAPASAEAHLELGIAYKWDWLESLEPESFKQSAEALARATAEAPDRADAWLELTALALVRGDARLAAEAAVHAQNAEPTNAMAVVALACA